MKNFHGVDYEVDRVGFMCYDVYVDGHRIDNAYSASDGETKAKKFIINQCIARLTSMGDKLCLSVTYIREHRDRLRADCKELLKVD